MATILFASLLALVSALLILSKDAAGRSYADATFRLAGRAALSEYDRRLSEDYGIFAFRGDERRIDEDLRFYSEASLSKNKQGYSLFVPSDTSLRSFDIKINELESNLKEFSLINVDIFEEQVNAAAASELAKSKINKGGDKDDDRESQNRTLRKGSIKSSLPSSGISGLHLPDLSQIGNIPSFEDVTSSVAKGVITDQYCIDVFGYAINGDKGKDTFFKNEVEYLLAGKFSDDDNYYAVKIELYLMRLALNNAALIKDRSRMAIITSIAAPFAAFAGIGEVGAEAAIFEAWAVAETHNDILLLDDGKNVALLKNHAQWATDNIAEIAKGAINTEPLMPLNTYGLDYGQYLRIMLFLTDRETKLLRMMDLIQINMKGSYYKDFLIREYYTGYRFKANINGHEFSYVERY